MMPAGEYYIGDLCYVLNDKQNDQLHKLVFVSDDNGRYYRYVKPGRKEGDNYHVQGEHILDKGVKVCDFSTEYGDGTYCDKEGRSYSVDSGMIGCVLKEYVKPDSDIELGNIVTFHKEMTAYRLPHGTIVFTDGDTTVKIKTR